MALICIRTKSCSVKVKIKQILRFFIVLFTVSLVERKREKDSYPYFGCVKL